MIKKLLFVLAFVFIGGQAYSQMYIVAIVTPNANGCASSERTLLTISPTGSTTKMCIPSGYTGSFSTEDPTNGLVMINQELNSIMNQVVDQNRFWIWIISE